MIQSTTAHKSIAGLLAAGLLLFLAATTGLTVAHDIQHAHHSAAMHGKGVCAWICAASQGVESDALWMGAASEAARLAEPGSDRERPCPSCATHLTRGPPSFLL